MKKIILNFCIPKAFTTALVIILLSSAALAEGNLLRQCYIVDDGGLTMSVRMYYGTPAFSGFSSLSSVALQAGKLNQERVFQPNSDEVRYDMKLISNFHKGAVYNVDIRWPTRNPGVLMYDAGTEAIQIAFYRTHEFGSVSGSGHCIR
jgi:hypothetical protein